MLFKSLLILAAFASVAHCDPRIRFIFYFGSEAFIETAQFGVDNLDTIVNHPSFNRNGQTVMFHYGAGQSLSTREVHDIITSYLFSREYNFIAISYEDNSIIGTDTAVELAAGITTGLIRLFDGGYNSGFMNLLGFSLGAQIMARASRQVQTQTSRRHIIGRLTGLDPWALGIITGITIGRLSSADAQWVESIHTEGLMRGDIESNGHVSFFLNGATTQPFCTGLLAATRADCSHIFALQVWAESVRSPSLTFPALSCLTWDDFITNQCNNNNVAHMGRSTESNLRGSYMLRTNMEAPWSRNTPLPFA